MRVDRGVWECIICSSPSNLAIGNSSWANKHISSDGHLASIIAQKASLVTVASQQTAETSSAANVTSPDEPLLAPPPSALDALRHEQRSFPSTATDAYFTELTDAIRDIDAGLLDGENGAEAYGYDDGEAYDEGENAFPYDNDDPGDVFEQGITICISVLAQALI